MSIFDDHTPRYVPDQVMTIHLGMDAVKRVTGYPPGQHPDKCPIIKTVSVIKVETVRGGMRWYDCDSFRINAELRMVITGTNSRDTVRMRWEPCRIP